MPQQKAVALSHYKLPICMGVVSRDWALISHPQLQSIIVAAGAMGQNEDLPQATRILRQHVNKEQCISKGHLLGLAQAMDASLGLQIDLRVPVAVIHYGCVCSLKVQPHSTCPGAQKEDEC